MQERHFNEIYKNLDSRKLNEMFSEKMETKISDQTVNLPEGMRTPVAAEIKDIINWMKQYKKQNPRASKRQLRSDTKKQFNITTLPNKNK